MLVAAFVVIAGVSGKVTTLSGERPPALRKIRIELNSAGKLDARGLPVCHYSQLVAASPKRALETCGDALVGEGSYSAQTAFPEQNAFPAQGHILAFNAIYGGHQAILAHIFGNGPLPIARVVVFHIRRIGGTYGTVITGELPDKVNHYGYVEGLSLRLHRRFVYRGRPHSYLSAACGAPAGFSKALFPFARASMAFAEGGHERYARRAMDLSAEAAYAETRVPSPSRSTFTISIGCAAAERSNPSSSPRSTATSSSLRERSRVSPRSEEFMVQPRRHLDAVQHGLCRDRRVRPRAQQPGRSR